MNKKQICYLHRSFQRFGFLRCSESFPEIKTASQEFHNNDLAIQLQNSNKNSLSPNMNLLQTSIFMSRMQPGCILLPILFVQIMMNAET